jgi:multimeric flavodoxin WrbA
MKILALNGSPRGKNSNTDRMLLPFLEGATSAGAETEILYSKDCKVDFCKGCFVCWNKTPGKCDMRDDMDGILDKFRTADIVVWASPLYHYGMTANLKRILERTLPMADPHMVKEGDVSGHPLREGYPQKQKWLLMSNCGFPEAAHFEAFVRQFQLMLPEEALESILRPMGELLKIEPMQPMLQWYFDALRKAGEEMAKGGRLSDATRELLGRDLMPPEQYRAMANKHWDEDLASLPKQGKEV